MLKILHGVQLGCDCDTGDIYLVDADGNTRLLTDGHKLESVTVTKPTTEYTAGDTVDFDFAEALYTDGTITKLTDEACVVEPDRPLTVDDTCFTVTFEYQGITKSCSVDITVTE